MNNDRNTNCTDVAIKNDKKSMQKHLIYRDRKSTRLNSSHLV